MDDHSPQPKLGSPLVAGCDLPRLAEMMSDIVVVATPGGQVLHANSAASRHLGFSVDELQSRPLLDWFSPDRRSEAESALSSLVRGEREWCPLQMMARDGSLVPVDTRAQRWVWEGVACILCVSTVRAPESAVRDTLDLLDATQRLAKVGGWEWDELRQTITWTDETYRIHGMVRGEVPEGSPEHITRSLACYDPEDRPTIETAFRRCVEEGVPYDLELRITAVDGRHKWVQTTARPELEGGRVSRVTGNIVDITSRKLASEEKRRREELERLIATVFSELVAARASEIDPTVERALALIGHYVGADRAYVFLFTDDLAAMNNTHEWCAPGIEPQKDELQALPSAMLPWWVARLQARETISIPVVAEMPPEASAERAILEPQGVQSLIVVPMLAPDRLLGFLGFDAVTARRMWLDSERDLLRSLGNTVVHALQRCRAEEELLQSEQEYRLLYQQFHGILNALPDAMCLISRDLKIIWANDVAAANMGMSVPEFLGQHCYESRHGLSAPCEGCLVLQSFASGAPVAGEGRTPDGRTWELHALPVYRENGEVASVIEAARDITERKQDEAERAKLQAQLAQAQKMESVGRLAGGVAHDFNNMLTVILGQAELALDRAGPDHTLISELQSIRRAAERSAGLTRQLLAFARQQTVAPQVLDLNEVVEGMLKMLRRLIGEDIDLAWLPGGGLWPVRIDPSQIDQILANLCVNARDAIGDTGKVTIETENVTVDEAYCSGHVGFLPGEFVVLAVSDDGCGMDADTLGRLFEPFFTTKELGKGTGLGLATIYGIVKQNQGFVNVYSEPGRGSTFRIYLPRHRTDPSERPVAEPVRPSVRSHGTILVVEDEPAILVVVKAMLERDGYAVLAASTPDEAIRLATTHVGEIRLLLTDVIMPRMNGRDLASRLRAFHPGIEPLFMSGYTANVIAHHGVLDEGVHFIAKPFSAADLVAKVEEVLRGKT